jgi:hypothetical protein
MISLTQICSLSSRARNQRRHELDLLCHDRYYLRQCLAAPSIPQCEWFVIVAFVAHQVLETSGMEFAL